jgi:hypothetical protein
MSPLLAIFPILGLALLFKRITASGFATGLVLSVSIILIFQYVLGLAGFLRFGASFLWIVGIICLCLLIWQDRRIFVLHLEFPLLLWVFLAIAFWFFHRNSYFGFYDEMSHWGIFVKELFYNHEFWGDGPHIRHPRYVPGPALWIYFVISFSPYSEGAAYLGQFLLLSAPLMLFFERMSWRQWPWIILILAWLAFGLANWGHGICDLHVDHLISAWFVGILLLGIYHSGDKHFRYLIVVPMCVLVLIKDVGLFFAIGSAGILLLWAGAKSWQSHGFKIAWLRPLCLWFVCCAVLPIVCVTAWKIERDNRGITRSSGTLEGMYHKLVAEIPNTDPKLIRFIDLRFWEVVLTQHISKGEPSRQFNVFNYFNKDEFTSKYRLLPIPLSTGLYVLIYTLGAFFMICWLRRRNREWIAWVSMFFSLWLMTLFYIFVLRNHYTSSPNLGGLGISSYMRYTHSMLLPLALTIILPLLPLFKDGTNNSHLGHEGSSKLTHIRPAFTLGLLISIFFMLDPPYFRPYYSPKSLNSFRIRTMPTTASLINRFYPEAKIWVHFPIKDNRFLAWTLQYQLAPLDSYVNNDEPGFLEKPLSQIAAEWGKYDLVWFLMLNEKDKAWLGAVFGEVMPKTNLIETSTLLTKLKNLSRKKNETNNSDTLLQ